MFGDSDSPFEKNTIMPCIPKKKKKVINRKTDKIIRKSLLKRIIEDLLPDEDEINDEIIKRH